jgi:membrane-bound metal-dependent hydrolase YbcI (DUF457 family)
MPSTLVHLAVGGLVAAGLLGAAFDRRALALCLCAAAVPDVDTFLGLWVRGGHRAILHTFLFPAALGVLLFVAERRWNSVSGRYRARGVTVAWVALGALTLGGIGPDLFTNGVNALWPVHDQFYRLSGQALFSNQRGFVQTFVELGEGGSTALGSTEEIHYRTGVDAAAGPDPENVERIFPLVMSGTQLLLVLSSVLVVGSRLVRER